MKDESGRSFEDYQAGLEESIRRCEELLACTPLTFLPPKRGSERKSLRDSLTSTCSCTDGVDGTTTDATKRDSVEGVSLSYSCPEDRSEVAEVLAAEGRSEAAQSVCVEDASSELTRVEDKSEAAQSGVVHSFSGDEVEIIIDAEPAKEDDTPITRESSKSHSQLKFCPLDDKPPRRAPRHKSATKEAFQFKDSTDLFNAIGEVMDNLKSYIHLPSLVPDNNATGKERLKSLSKPRTEVYKRLAEVKQIIEEKQLKECSFKPAVKKKPDSNLAPVLERLTEAQQQKELRKRQARKVIEKEELAACSFRPQINHNSPYYEKNTSQPLPERFKELERRRRERLEKAMREQDHELTFKPEINPKSVQLFKQRGLETVDLQDRLTTLGPSVHMDCKNEMEATKAATFYPEINSNTDQIIACSRQFGGISVDFYERQQHFLHMLQEKRKQKENEMSPDFTFTPNIGNSELILRQSMCGELFPETAEERVKRLAYKDKANQMQIRKKVAAAKFSYGCIGSDNEKLECHLNKKAQDDYYGQFNFQPEIDEVSRLVGRTSTIQDLHVNKQGEELKKQLEDAAEAEFRSKCPFRPMTFTGQNNKQGVRSNLIERLLARKDPYPSYVQESWTMKEMEEFKQCTFKPYVNRLRPKDSPPAIIKGVDRYLELQQIAKQMKKDQENYEKKVFFSHVASLPVRQYTIPQPFSFTEQHYKYESKPGSPEPN